MHENFIKIVSLTGIHALYTYALEFLRYACLILYCIYYLMDLSKNVFNFLMDFI